MDDTYRRGIDDTYHLGCTQCKEQIWIGQRVAGSRGLFLYGGLLPIEKFLVAHRGHPLIFDALVAFESFREMELGQDGILHPLPACAVRPLVVCDSARAD